MAGIAILGVSLGLGLNRRIDPSIHAPSGSLIAAGTSLLLLTLSTAVWIPGIAIHGGARRDLVDLSLAVALPLSESEAAMLVATFRRRPVPH